MPNLMNAQNAQTNFNSFDFLTHDFNLCPIVATANGKSFSQVLHHIRNNEFCKHLYLSTCNKNTPPELLKAENDKPLNGELSLYIFDGVLMCAVGEIAFFSRSPSIKYPFSICENYKNAVIECFKFLCVPPTLMSTPQSIAPYLISQSTCFPFSKSFLNFVSLYGENVLNLVNGSNCLPFQSNVKTFKFAVTDAKNDTKNVENGLKPSLNSSPSPAKNALKPALLPSKPALLPSPNDTLSEQKQVEIYSDNVGGYTLETMIQTIYDNAKLDTNKNVKRMLTKCKTPNQYIDTLFEAEMSVNIDAVFSDFVYNIFIKMTV